MGVSKKLLNYKKIYKIIDKKEIVSFDIFDTLITRMVIKPKQIFNIVENRYNASNKNKISDFTNYRINAEKKINDNIPNIDDIYHELEKQYAKDVCAELKQIEIDTEMHYCICNQAIKKIYDYCKMKKKKIYAISDMYLSSGTLKKILNKSGYEVDKLLVSCEANCNKQSAELFKKIDINTRKKMVHIGDSFKADFLGARIAKVHSIKIKKNVYNESLDNLEALKYKGDDNYFYNIGFNILGPVLLEFCKWLDMMFTDKQITKIYFFSREGYIFKKVFDELYDSNYDTKYLYVSRKTMTIANYKYEKIDNFQEMLKYFTIKQDTTLRDMARYLDIEIEENELNNKKIYSLINDDHIYNDLKHKIIKSSEQANEITRKYFSQEKITGKFAVVDIGWNGTMQRCMQKFLKNNKCNCDLEGFYFTKFKDFKNSYSFIKYSDMCYDSIKDNPVFIENLFQKVDGSTIGYKKSTKSQIVPIKREIEFNEYSQNAIEKIDLGILDFISKWKKYGYVGDEKEMHVAILNDFNNYIINPKKKDINMYKDFCYSDIKNEYIISNTKNIKSGLISSAWKYGYLKSILKLKINYKSIIRILKKISGD